MNAPDNDPAPVAAPAPSAPSPTSPAPEAPRRAGVGLTLLALLVAAAALVMAGMMWQRLNLTQAELARRAHDAELQVVEARTVASQAEAQVPEMNRRFCPRPPPRRALPCSTARATTTTVPSLRSTRPSAMEALTLPPGE